MSREDDIKAGAVERLNWGSGTVFLYWEVWADAPVNAAATNNMWNTVPLQPTFIVELVNRDGPYWKQAFLTLAEADAKYESIKRKYAVEIAKTALGISTRTINIIHWRDLK